MPPPDRTRDGATPPEPGPETTPTPEPAPEPKPAPDPKAQLAHIAEISKNARATWFGLLGLLAFVGVTLMSHEDADFFAFGAATQLPLINITVPVKSFFNVAPLLVAALYIYLHLYLMILWDALGDLEQQGGAPPIADQVFPWLLSHAALWYRNLKQGDGSATPHLLGWVVVIISIALGWFFGLAVLAALWLRSMPAHDAGLTLWIGLCLWAAILIGRSAFLAARVRMEGMARTNVPKTLRGRRMRWGALALALAFFSWWGTTKGEILKYAVTNDDGSTEWRNVIDAADLAEAELTRKPLGWLPWHLRIEDFEEKFRKRKGIAPSEQLAGETETAFKKEAKERYAEYIAQLDAPGLKDADLREANLFRAFLPGADLREAEMQGADLSWAEMQNVECAGATLRAAPAHSADLTCTNLTQDQLEEVIGSRTTIVPDGLHVWSCWQTPPETLDETLATLPESVREERRARWLCAPGQKRHATGSWPFERRYLTDFKGID